MPNKKHVVQPEAEAGKSISTQLSDLRSGDRAMQKLFSKQQAQLNEMQVTLDTLWKRIGV